MATHQPTYVYNTVLPCWPARTLHSSDQHSFIYDPCEAVVRLWE